MIRAAIISPDQGLAAQLQETLSKFSNVGVGRVLHQYPNEAKLPAFLKASLPELIFLSFDSVDDATDVVQRIASEELGVAVVAIGPACDATRMLEVLRAGARDFLAAPFEAEATREVLNRVETLLTNRTQKPTQNAPIFAFLPAKAGAGATTIAVNTSQALARLPGVKPLLIDLDLNSGLVQFMLSMKPQFSIVEAAENAANMDETMWSKVVTSTGNLDVLPAGFPETGFRIEPSQIRRILEFAERNYSAVCVDLSGMMEKYSVEVIRQVKQIFLVCTPEVASLHLANIKLEVLRRLELDDRVSILLNRADQQIPVSTMEQVLKKKIFMELPNAYELTRKASVEGKPIDIRSKLGTSYLKLAQTMVPVSEPKKVEPRRGLLDLFRAPEAIGSRATDAA
jgi:pilus assembly protein CpaE